jgi:hypothetical protein
LLKLFTNNCELHPFLNGYLPEINEAVVIEAEKAEYPGYRYHFQDADNRLVFRYDNTPHFPDIETYPHHKHLPENVFPAEKPLLQDVIRETVRYLSAHE